MKRLFTVSILVAIVAAAFMAVKYVGTHETHERLPDRPLVVAVIDQYPPFSYVAENGERMGYDFDLGHDICRMMKVRCVFKAFPLRDIRALLEDNKVDVAIAGLRASPERLRTFAFSDAYYRSLPFFITNHLSLIPGDFYIFDLTQGSFEAPRGIGFVRICESPPIKKLLNQGWCGLLLRGGPVRHLGDAAGVNLDRCGGRP